MKQTTLTFTGDNGYRMWIEWWGDYPFTREHLADKMDGYGYTLLETWEIFCGDEK